jgi:hypothetical protein
MTTQIPAVELGVSRKRNAFPTQQWLRVFTLFFGTIWFEVPIGYQDETGFHYGEPVYAEIRYCGDI